MAGESSQHSSSTNINQTMKDSSSSPYILHPYENLGIVIVSCLFKEENYPTLSLPGSSDLRGISTNYRYLDHLTFRTSVTRYKPAKKGFDGGVSTASPIIKSAKWRRKERRELAQLELHTLSLVRCLSVLYSNFSLIIGKIIS